jgi:hypothetical protein
LSPISIYFPTATVDGHHCNNQSTCRRSISVLTDIALSLALCSTQHTEVVDTTAYCISVRWNDRPMISLVECLVVKRLSGFLNGNRPNDAKNRWNRFNRYSPTLRDSESSIGSFHEDHDTLRVLGGRDKVGSTLNLTHATPRDLLIDQWGCGGYMVHGSGIEGLCLLPVASRRGTLELSPDDQNTCMTEPETSTKSIHRLGIRMNRRESA